MVTADEQRDHVLELVSLAFLSSSVGEDDGASGRRGSGGHGSDEAKCGEVDLVSHGAVGHKTGMHVQVVVDLKWRRGKGREMYESERGRREGDDKISENRSSLRSSLLPSLSISASQLFHDGLESVGLDSKSRTKGERNSETCFYVT